MKRSSRTPGKRPVPLWIRLALLAAVIILLVWSIILTRDKLLRNAKEMGIYLAESYAMEEENRINVYSLLLGIGSSYLDDNISQGLPTSDSRRLLEQYSDKLTAILGNPIIDPYAVIQGEIIAANPWEGDDSYDYSQTQWYQEALAAELSQSAEESEIWIPTATPLPEKTSSPLPKSSQGTETSWPSTLRWMISTPIKTALLCRQTAPITSLTGITSLCTAPALSIPLPRKPSLILKIWLPRFEAASFRIMIPL